MKKNARPISNFILPLLLIVGLCFKLIFLWLNRENPFFEPRLLDPRYYHQWALRILSGDWVGEGVFYGLPLYPFVLAALYQLTHASVVAVKIFQALAGLATIFLCYKIGVKLHSKKAGLLSAALAVFYGPLFFHEQIFIPESLAIPLYTGSFLMACVYWEAPSIKKALILGALLGLSALTKAGVIPFLFCLILMGWVRPQRPGGRDIKITLSLVAGFIILIAPVTAHNLVFGKDFVPLTSHGGFNFYIGNNERAEGVFMTPEGVGSNVEAQKQDSRVIAENALGRKLKPSEVSGYWSNRAWDFIRQNPGDFFKLFLKKVTLFFDHREISDVEDYEFSKRFNAWLRFPWLTFAFIGPLFLVGLATLPGKSPFRAITWLWVGSYIVSVSLFFVNARYRLPLLGVCLPLASLGILSLVDTFKERAWKKLTVCAVVLVAGIALTQMQWVGTTHARNFTNAGDIYLEERNFEKAEEFYREAIAREPDFVKANLALGVLFTRCGRHEEAKNYYEKTLKLDPKNDQAYNNLGLWYDAQGDLKTAEELFLKAAAAKASSSQAHNNLGMVYAKLGLNDKAKEELLISLKINPHSERALTNLGLVHYRLGELAESERCFEKALSINPDFSEAQKAIRLLKSRK